MIPKLFKMKKHHFKSSRLTCLFLSKSIILVLAILLNSCSTESKDSQTLTIQKSSNSTQSKKYDLSIVYEDILQSLTTFNTTIDLSKYNLQPGQIFNTIDLVFENNPEIFYTEKQSIKIQSNNILKVEYDYPKEILEKMQNELHHSKVILLTELSKISDPYKKLLFIHNYLIKNSEYGIDNNFPKLAHTSYGILVSKKGVCNGYSKAFQLLTSICKIKCFVEYGQIEEGLHSWNKVEINGDNLLIDVTLDKSLSKGNNISTKYFNPPSEVFYEGRTLFN